MTNPLLPPAARKTVLLYSGEDAARLEEMDDELEAAWIRDATAPTRAGVPLGTEADEVAAHRDAFLEEAKGRALSIVFEAISHRTLESLRDQSPPRKGNRADEAAGYDRESFPFALLRASLVEPSVTDDQWKEFIENAPASRVREWVEVAEELATQDVNLPKLSAVMTLTRLREREHARPRQQA